MVANPILHKDGLPTSTCRIGLPSKGGSDSSERGYQLFRETFFVSQISNNFKNLSYKTMNDQKQKSWFSRHIILTGILGFILFVAIIGTLAELTGNSEEANLPPEPQVQSEYIGRMLKLNSCLLDPSNADYWQGKEVNFWSTAKRDSVAFKLPACDNIELEIVDYANEDGNELFKVKNGNQEGWASKMQLMK